MRGLLRREIDGRALLRSLRRRDWELLIASGVVARLLEYLRDRPPWLDEGSLAANILRHGAFETPSLLTNDQLAPFGFLTAERLIATALGGSWLALRLLPFLAGLATLPLFARLARATLDAAAARWALGLFALADALIYFGCELKPYIADVAAALVVSLFPTSARFAASTRRELGRLALAGMALVWFSFPVAFALAGVGTVWIVSAALGRDRRSVGLAIGVAVAWGVSFVGSYLVGRRLLGPFTGMWAFWAFAFPEPTASDVLLWFPAQLVEFFANPLQFDTPIGAVPSAYLGFALAILGAASLGRRDREGLVRIVLPVGLALAAGAARLYPFHGRLVLFLVPAAYLLLGEGLGRVAGRLGSIGARLLLAFVFFWPVVELVSPLLEPRWRPFSPFGDLRIDPFRPLPAASP